MKPQLYIWLSVILLISGLSSCHTSVYQYVWQRAKVVDDVWFQHPDGELYRVGNKVYSKVYRARGRGCYVGSPIHMMPVRNGMATYWPDDDNLQEVYLPLSDKSTAEVLHAADNNIRCVTHVDISEDESGDLSALPESAQKLTVIVVLTQGAAPDRRMKGGHWKPHTDVHKYYAYPLGILTAVAVDAPLTIAGNCAVAASCVVALPFVATYKLIESCTSQATESP